MVNKRFLFNGWGLIAVARLVAIYEAVDNPFSKVWPALLEHVVVRPELNTAVRQKASRAVSGELCLAK